MSQPGMPLDHGALLAGLLAPMAAAGRLQLALRAQGLVAGRKADDSLVTEADRASEALLLAALAELAPLVPVVAEEACAAGQTPTIGRRFFLVDPLDGTREYVAGGADFTVNVALIEDARPRFGLILAPATGEFYATLADDRAARGWLDLAAATDHVLCPPLAAIATRTPPADGLVAVMSRSFRSSEDDRFAVRHHVVERLSVGSSLKFCVVARGEADVYPRFGSICEWDTAAGHAILEAAGGVVMTTAGLPLRYGNAAGHFVNPPFVAWGRWSAAAAVTATSAEA